MTAHRRQESDFAEVLVDRLFLESFANEQSAYHDRRETRIQRRLMARFHTRLKWHIDHSLSARQKQVIRGFLRGEREREIAAELGVTQQVVNIYKRRAIKRLHDLLAS
jgi:DNA-binding NarL/FixJ family response regulator